MKNKIVIIVGAVIIFILSVLGGWFARIQYDTMNMNNAKKTAQLFIETLVNNKPADAYKFLSADAKKDTTLEEFTKSFKGAAISDPSYLNTQVSVYEDGTYLVFRSVCGYPAKDNGSNEASFNVGLEREGGDFKVTAASAQ